MRELERHFHALLRNVADVILVVGADGIIRTIFPTVERILGYPPEEVEGRNGFSFIHPDDVPILRESLARSVEQPGVNVVSQARIRHADGGWRPMEVINNNLLADPDVAGVLVTIRDISERLRAEEALREQERYLRLVTENSRDIVALYDREGHVQYVSPTFEPWLGYTREEYMSGHFTDVAHPEDVDRVWATWNQAVAGSFAQVSFRVLRKDGEYVWVECLATPICDSEGRVTQVQVASRDITERKTFEEQLAYLAYHDPLTGLSNRTAFTATLDASLAGHGRERGDLAVLFLDLDNFKIVNDSLGHQAGDQLLAEVAGRLRACLAPEDVAARMGGDEFTILMEKVSGAHVAIGVAGRILAELSRPFALEGQEVWVMCSVGIAMATAEHAQHKELLRDANTALHHAKKRGKAGYVVYAPSMKAAALERLQLESELRRALERGELEVHYQPIIALQTGEAEGAEALVRWRHPVRGLIPPDQFIPLAEETGLIVPLGRWVLEEACREGQRWQAERTGRRPPVISVNLSAREFQHPGLAEDVAEVLSRTGLEPRLLQLEITESTLMSFGGATIAALQALERLGMSLAVDDFGTGYSSLSYLKRFPVGMLKIDRSFISGLGTSPDDTALVQTMVSLARTLGLRVTAEGIETREQMQILRELGCDLGQGYFFSQPVPAAQLRDVFAGRRIAAPWRN
jgi:diguanylate cyclase (GGDEF)-like protein/PAS domain S-box-containing protein